MPQVPHRLLPQVARCEAEAAAGALVAHLPWLTREAPRGCFLHYLNQFGDPDGSSSLGPSLLANAKYLVRAMQPDTRAWEPSL